MINPTWMPLAERELGVLEMSGSANNDRILEYHSKTKLGAEHDEVPWCSSFVCFILDAAGFYTTESALARSWVDWGIPRLPTYGSVLVFRRGNHEWQGHVGFYVYQDRGHYYVLGGNQKDSVSVLPYPKKNLIASVWPRIEDIKNKKETDMSEDSGITLVNANILVGKETKEAVDFLADLVADIRLGKDLAEIASENLPALQAAITDADKIVEEVRGTQVSETIAYIGDKIGDAFGL